jgi:hypothetical protein
MTSRSFSPFDPRTYFAINHVPVNSNELNDPVKAIASIPLLIVDLHQEWCVQDGPSYSTNDRIWCKALRNIRSSVI